MTAPRQPQGPEVQSVTHGARAGRWAGNHFNVVDKYLAPSQPRALIGAVTDFNGTALRPMPGLVPLGSSFSLDHRVEVFPEGDLPFEIDGMTLWVLTDGTRSQRVVALVNHSKNYSASGTPHPFGGEAMLVRGVTLDGLDRLYHNHAPLVRRKPVGAPGGRDYEIEEPSFKPAAAASMDEFQPTEFTPNMLVVAATGNPVKALVGSSEAPGAILRQFGLNAPQGDVRENAATTAPFGDQIELSDGVTTTLDPDQDWAISLAAGGSLTADIDDVPPSGPYATAFRIGIVIPTGSAPAGDIVLTGATIDLETGEVTEGDTETIAVSGLSVSNNGTKYLWSRWTNAYVSTKYFVSTGGVPPTFDSSVSIAFQPGGSGAANKILAFKVGRPVSDERPQNDETATTHWRYAVAWGRVEGDYTIRSGHNDFPENKVEETGERFAAPMVVFADQNIQLRGFGDPLGGDEPTVLYILLRQFPTPDSVTRPEGAAGLSVFDAFLKVREVPIRYDNVADNWLTNTGFPAHDLDLEDVVVDNPFTKTEMVAADDSWPGAVVALGDFGGCARWNNSMWFWNRPRYLFAEIIATQGSALFESSLDRFEGWMVARKLVFRNKTFNIRRVLIQEAGGGSNAIIETVEKWTDADATDSGHLKEELNTFQWTIPGSEFAENSPATWRKSLPVNDEIQAFLPERNYAIAFGKRFRFLITQDLSGSFFKENVDIPVTNIEVIGVTNAAAGQNSVARADDALVSYSGQGLAVGFNPDDLRDIAGPANSSLWRDLLDESAAAHVQLAYDEAQGHVIASNVKTLRATYPNVADHGLIFDFRNDAAMALAWPWPTRAAGVADLDRGRDLSSFRDAAIVLAVTVATAGTGGAVSAPGDYIVVYDVLDDAFSAISLAPYAALISGISEERRAIIQDLFGKIYLEVGDNPHPSEMVRLKIGYNANDKAWRVEEDNSELLAPYEPARAMAASWEGEGYYWLAPAPESADMALYHVPTGSVRLVAAGRGAGDLPRAPVDAELARARFKSLAGLAGFAAADIAETILLGPSGEIYLLGDDAGATKVLRLDPATLQPLEQPVALAGVPPGGYRLAAMNRHKELFVAAVDGADVKMFRHRFPDLGFAGDTTLLEFAPATTAHTGPDTKVGLLVDQRQQAIAVVSEDFSGDLGFRVYCWGEADRAYVNAPVSRAGFDRRCLSLAQAGHFLWYLVEDTPAAGPVEYRLAQAVGVATLPENGLPAGDGKPHSNEAGGFFEDLTARIAGAGGSLSYVSMDGTIQGAAGQQAQAAATNLVGLRGYGRV